MKRFKTVSTVMVAAVIICLACTVGVYCVLFDPFTRVQAIRVARDALMNCAAEDGLTMTELEVDGYHQEELSPAEKANGMQADVRVDLRYAYKRAGDQNWTDDDARCILEKRGGEWQIRFWVGGPCDGGWRSRPGGTTP